MMSYRKTILEELARVYFACIDNNGNLNFELLEKKLNNTYALFAYKFGALYARAMAELLYKPIEQNNVMMDKVMMGELFAGNYGLRKIAYEQSNVKVHEEVVKIVTKEVGAEAAERYVKSLNPCVQKVLQNQSDIAQSLDAMLGKVVGVITDPHRNIEMKNR